MDKNSYFDISIPDYIPCIYPLVSSFLKSKNLKISTGLLANMALIGIPTFSLSNKIFNPMVKLSDVVKLKYNLIDEKLCIKGTGREVYDENKEEYLNSYIDKNGIAIISGTSYYLPYSNDYLSDEYIQSLSKGRYIGIVDHWLSINKITKDVISIYDPVPNKFYGEINKSYLMPFWKGDKGVRELQSLEDVKKLLQYGIFDISIKRVLSQQEITSKTKETLELVKSLYFKQITIKEGEKSYYYGQKAIQNLKIMYINEMKDGIDDISREKVWRCFFEIKYSLFFVKLLIDEIIDYYEAKVRIQINDNMNKSIDTWQKISNIIEKNNLKKKSVESVKKDVISHIDYAVDKENKLFELIDFYKA